MDKDSFLDFFKYHGGKKIVLFMDEFDFLLKKPQAQEELYQALRSIKGERVDSYGLQAVVAVGPYSILRYSPEELSPFNVFDHWEAPYFTKAQVEQLFKEFQDSTGVVLEKGVVDDIYYRTQGHPGITCYCGKAILENLLQLRNVHELSLKDWRTYATFQLPG